VRLFSTGLNSSCFPDLMFVKRLHSVCWKDYLGIMFGHGGGSWNPHRLMLSGNFGLGALADICDIYIFSFKIIALDGITLCVMLAVFTISVVMTLMK